MKLLKFSLMIFISFNQLYFSYAIETLSSNNSIIKKSKRSLDSGLSTEYWKLILSSLALSFCLKELILKTEDKEDIRCMIDIKKLRVDHALIIEPDDHTKFKYPKNNDGVIVMKKYEKVFLSCGYNQHNFLKITSEKWKSQTFECEIGVFFKANDTKYNIYDLSCSKPPQSVIKKENAFEVRDKFTKYTFGFKSDSKGSLIEVNSILTTKDKYSPLLASSVIPAYIKAQQNHMNSFKIFQDECCSNEIIDTNKFLRSINQKIWSKDHFDSSSAAGNVSCKYSLGKSQSALSRTLLTPKTSFMYSIGSNVTFAYLNTALIWSSILSGNFHSVEAHIYRLARELKRNIEIHSGVGNVLVLNDGTSKKCTQLKLLIPSESYRVPEYFYKIAINQESNTGVAFIIINNPYLDQEEIEKIHLCEKPIRESLYIEMPKNWKPEDVQRGYSFMCNVEDFLKTSGILKQIGLMELEEFYPSAKNLLYIPKKGFNAEDFILHDEVSDKEKCPVFSPPLISTDTTCKFEFEKRPSDPLIIDPVTLEILPPNQQNQIIIHTGQTVIFSCGDPGALNIPDNPMFKNFTCLKNKKIKSDGHIFSSDEITCNDGPALSFTKQDTDKENNIRYLTVGFKVDPNKYTNLFRYAYFEGETHFSLSVDTIFTRDTARAIRTRQGEKNVPTNHKYPSIMPGITYEEKFDLTDAYGIEAQEDSFLAQELSVESRKGNLLIPQLLLAQDYFLAEIVKSAANAYLNTRPMWGTIAEGNWAKTEEHVFKLPIHLNRDLKIYSGAGGVLMTWRRSNSQYYPLLLDPKREFYTIPRYFYKIIVDPVTRAGIVYVTINDPWIRKDPNEFYPACAHPVDLPKFELPNWSNTNRALGYSFACTVQDYMFTAFDFHLRSELHDVRDLLSIIGARYPQRHIEVQTPEFLPWEAENLSTTTTTTEQPVTEEL